MPWTHKIRVGGRLASYTPIGCRQSLLYTSIAMSFSGILCRQDWNLRMYLHKTRNILSMVSHVIEQSSSSLRYVPSLVGYRRNWIAICQWEAFNKRCVVESWVAIGLILSATTQTWR